MRGKVVVITGGNSGIGRQAAVELARCGASVVIAARDRRRGQDAVEEVRRRSGSASAQMVDLDLASLGSVRRCAAELLERLSRIDVLINNAGGILTDRQLSEDGVEMTFAVNHLGHHALTRLLTDRLTESAPARVVTVASFGHRMSRGIPWDDIKREGSYIGGSVYVDSKLANVLFAMELAERLAGTGVTSNVCHPGMVRTGFGAAEDTRGIERLGVAVARPFMVPASRGADPLVYLASAPELDNVTGAYFSGGYWPGVHQSTPARRGRDPEAARQLWELSEEMAGLTEG